ncbi:MAG: hypothetical protein H5U05_09905 [Candidatus Aminicenantes bacterium]|nr:hypothetical protein [Candidatus Aminicenantes bacterium]
MAKTGGLIKNNYCRLSSISFRLKPAQHVLSQAGRQHSRRPDMGKNMLMLLFLPAVGLGD